MADVDSAVSLPTAGGVLKVYKEAERLFQIGNPPIGVAVFGMGALGTQTLGSYLQEFEVRDPGNIISNAIQLSEVVQGLRAFLWQQYEQSVVPSLEAATGKAFADIPPEQVPAFGLVVGGFSQGAYLSVARSAREPHPPTRWTHSPHNFL